MPSKISVKRSTVVEGNDVFLTNLIVMADGTNLILGDLAGDTFEVRVFDVSGAGEGRTPNTSIYTDATVNKESGGPAGGACIFDTLQTTYWDGAGGDGYNFVYQLRWDSASSTGPYLRAGHTYHVKFTMDCDSTGSADFGVVRWTHILDVMPGDPT
jgi:hypothetical protein